VWLAVIAVSTLSYASYLLQRFVLPGRGAIVAAALGGLYSSTATTVVLARDARDEGVTAEITAGIVIATAMMYLRMLVVVVIFNATLARAILVPMLVLAAISAAIAALLARVGPKVERDAKAAMLPSNPLQLGTALIFAVLLIVISVVSTWVQAHLGAHGVLALAAVVGFTDIDPFVVSLAQGSAASIGIAFSAVAIVVASSSNNLLKAIYTLAFSRRREALVPAAALGVLCVLGLITAWIMAR
jgi:uncharacterized membrane protein (DUF4010 family)